MNRNIVSEGLQGARQLSSGFVAPTLAFLATVALGWSSLNTIEPGQVGLRVNNLSGSQTAITQPGLAIEIPFVHSLHILDGAPQTFTMKDTKDQGVLAVRELVVRANDGSNFHFDEFTLMFRLTGDESVRAIANAGPGEGYLKWMKPYARSVLRDEFGRESTIDVSDPGNYTEAAKRAQDRLNELLGPHGIIVTQIVTPRPKFNKSYEAAIEQRNALGNQLEVIRSDLARAETERSRELAVVDQTQNKLIQEKRASMQSELAKAEAELAEVKREADTYRISKVAEGQASLSAATVQAIELEGELEARYIAKRAEIEAFKTQPVEKVMQRLGEQLRGVTVNIEPFANDATPSRIRLEQ